LALNCHASSVVERGVSVGYPFGAKHENGFEYMNVVSLISHPARGEFQSRNTVADIPVIIYNKPNDFLGGQFQVHAALPPPEAERGPEGTSWRVGTNNPLVLLGVAWDLPYGFSFSNSVGGFFPWQSSISAMDAWTFIDAFAVSYYKALDYNFSATLFLGFTGINYKYHQKTDPDFINLSLTATRTFDNIEFGPIAYFTQDISGEIRQAQFSMGGLIGFYFKNFYIQAWYGHDTYQQNYQSLHSGGFVRTTVHFDKI
jgi:Putative MetA-pathway of phenol degradation